MWHLPDRSGTFLPGGALRCDAGAVLRYFLAYADWLNPRTLVLRLTARALSYGIMQKHGSEIRVDSEVGSSTFRVLLPIRHSGIPN